MLMLAGRELGDAALAPQVKRILANFVRFVRPNVLADQ
jgi:hypothetical protein